MAAFAKFCDGASSLTTTTLIEDCSCTVRELVSPYHTGTGRRSETGKSPEVDPYKALCLLPQEILAGVHKLNLTRLCRVILCQGTPKLKLEKSRFPAKESPS